MTDDAKLVSCPKCQTRYKVRANVTGQMRCKNCDAVFSVGAQASKDNTRRRNTSDQATAVRLILLCVGVLVVVGLIVIGLNSTTSPTGDGDGKKKKDPPRGSYAPIGSSAGGSGSGGSGAAIAVETKEPERVAKAFVTAIAEEDEAALAKLFLFDQYYEWVAFKYRWPKDDDRRYSLASPEKQQEMREEAIEAFLEPEQVAYFKELLVPSINAGTDLVEDAGTAKRFTPRRGDDWESYQWAVKDENGKNILTLLLTVRLKKGLDPAVDRQRPDAWGVQKVEVQWLISTLRIAKPDKRGPVDVLVGRKRKEESERKRRAARGPVEADPAVQDPFTGTGPTQTGIIRDSISKISNRDAGAEAFAAADELVKQGKIAIPFLLNALIGKNHESDEQQVWQSFQVVQVLREITGESFGYGPASSGGMMGMATATPEERTRAVRRWFGWWKENARTWTGRTEEPEEEEGEEDG